MRTGRVATIAACAYVVAWSALLGNLADNLTTPQEVAVGTVAVLGGALILVALRALILEQRFLARQENLEALEQSRNFARVLMDNLPAAIWLKTPTIATWRVISCGPSSTRRDQTGRARHRTT